MFDRREVATRAGERAPAEATVPSRGCGLTVRRPSVARPRTSDVVSRSLSMWAATESATCTLRLAESICRGRRRERRRCQCHVGRQVGRAHPRLAGVLFDRTRVPSGRGLGGITHPVGPRSGFLPALPLLLATLFSLACSAPSEPPPPPSGGQRPVLDFARFVDEIEPLFARHGCAMEGACHGGGIRGTFELSPRSAPDAAFDFAQTSLQVDALDPQGSLLLLKPLALDAGGLPHSAKPFASRDDTDFRALSDWATEVKP